MNLTQRRLQGLTKTGSRKTGGGICIELEAPESYWEPGSIDDLTAKTPEVLEKKASIKKK